MPTPPEATWLVRIYRDDSLTPLVYEHVNWPRERFTWFQLERES